MPPLFEIIRNKDDDKSCSIGINLKIGSYETLCPLTDFKNCEDVKSIIGLLKEDLENLLSKLEMLKNGKLTENGSDFDFDTSPEEIWAVIEKMPDNESIVEMFNSLDEDKRREAAEYIFANCSMFSGKGAFFSAQYVQETGLLTV